MDYEKQIEEVKDGVMDQADYFSFLAEALEFSKTHPEYLELPKESLQDFCQLYAARLYKDRNLKDFSNMLRVYTSGFIQAKRETSRNV